MALSASTAWRRLIDASANLTTPALLPRFFPQPPIDETEVLAAFRRVCAVHDGQLMSTLRVYQGGRREDLEYALFATPPVPGDTLRTWQRRLAGASPTAIILNRAERWSAAIGTLGAQLNHGLSGGDPSKLLTVEAVLFLGDYGYSPFGVHADKDPTKVVHIPLTAAAKSLFTWPVGIFERATGGRTPCFDPEPLIPLADRHCYRGGDLFFLPATLFHVGHSPHMTATLAFVLTPRIPPLPLDGAAAALANHVGADWPDAPSARALPLDDVLAMTREHRDMQFTSSLGLSASLEYEADGSIDGVDRPFAIIAPFQIVVQRSRGLIVHVRGTSFALLPGISDMHVEELCALFAVLNTGESLTLRLARHVAPNISIGALERILSLLMARHILAPTQ